MDFQGKNITVIGLGLLGGALNDIRYLADHGAKLTVTDLKTPEELQPSLEKLSAYQNITFVLGKHRLEDFQKADLILQPGNVPPDSPYLLESKKNNIPIFVSESLFANYLTAGVMLVGVTGTRGKSTTTHLIYEILKSASGARVFLAGNVKNVSTLALLDEVQSGDVVVLELDSWALRGMGEIKKSPEVAVFTTFFKDHMNFYKNDLNAYLDDKANIFKFQKADDVLVLGRQCAILVQEKYPDIESKVVITDAKGVPADWQISIPGEHNRYNIACAIEAARALDISDDDIKKVVESFKGVPGRLELIREVNGVKIYNDTTATTPEATIAALRALADADARLKIQDSKIILIMGGADKGLDVSELAEEIPKYSKEVILLSGTGTEKIKNAGFKSEARSLEEAVRRAMDVAKPGDVILFSPAFASFGMFKNEFDRGEQFNSCIKLL